MRGEPNSVGIPTKRSSRVFLIDENYDMWMTHSAKGILRLILHKGDLVWPEDGIGTGLAELEQRAPKIWEAIKSLETGLGKI